jgi:FtsH-binding integral membrane protein
MNTMNRLKSKTKLPAAAAFGSLFLILLLTLLTNPLNSVVAVAFFFLLLAVFLVSFGFAFLEAQSTDSSADKRKVLVICSVVVILLMFRSAKALSLIDAVLMLIFFSGLLFYISRR